MRHCRLFFILLAALTLFSCGGDKDDSTLEYWSSNNIGEITFSQQIIARLKPDSEIVKGSMTELYIDTKKIYFFHKLSGERILTPNHSGSSIPSP